MLHPDGRGSSRGTPNRVVVSRVEAVRTDSGRRLAVVTLYQYEGNITTNRLVDLDNNTIVNERVSSDVGTPVGAVEAEYARSLLMSDARVQELMAPFQGAVEIGLIPTVVTDPCGSALRQAHGSRRDQHAARLRDRRADFRQPVGCDGQRATVIDACGNLGGLS